MPGKNSQIPKFDNDASISRGPKDLTNIDALVHKLFEDYVETNNTENIICIEEYGTNHVITYGELNIRANQLARVILSKMTKSLKDGTSRRNADGDLIVALRFLPNIELIVTILALLKCGIAYVPIAPNWPSGRIKLIIEDAKPSMFLTNTKVDLIYKAISDMENDSLVPPVHQISDLEYEGKINFGNCVDNLAANETLRPLPTSLQSNERLFAVLYTSGSTGRPKGARILHRSVLNRLIWQWKTFPYSPKDTCMFKTTLTFVDSISEIWGPLIKGIKLMVLPNKVTQNVELFVEALEKCRVTRLFAVTSLIRNILALLEMEKKKDKKSRLSNIYQWECSAEAVTPELVRQFFKIFPTGKTICNFYGSTEMSDVTYATFCSLEDFESKLDSNRVPIGKPVLNSIAYVLDDEKMPVPLGETGQLYVSSKNLCDGYVGKNNNNFGLNKFESKHQDEVLYCTGDYVKMKRENGCLYYEGRCDSQIKVRGHRVDLSEIQAAVEKINGVEKAVVLCYKPNEPGQKVICFFTAKTFENDKVALNEVTLEETLRAELPCYMLPKPVKLPVIPTLVNGKVDRQALLKRYDESRKSTFNFSDEDLSGYVCSDDFERARLLLNAVAQVLVCTEKPNLGDNFFEIGGDSINMVQVISRCFDYGFRIGITEFSLANNLTAIVSSMNVGDETQTDLSNLKELINQDFGFISVPLELEHKEVVIDMISRSFAEKGDLTTLANVTYDVIAEQVQVLWASLYKAGLSIVIKDGEKIIGACLNFDARSEEAAPLCANAAFSRNMPIKNDENNLNVDENEMKMITADDSAPKREESAVPMSVVEFLDAVEEPLKDQYLPEARGKTIYASLLGTAADLSPVDNVKITLYMEMENIRFGKEKGYEGIFTTNANRLTQHISRILGYQILSTIQVNQYEDANGSRPFAEAPDDLVTEVALKWFE